MQDINLFVKRNHYYNLSIGYGEGNKMNTPMYNTEIQLVKGIDNKLQFSIRNHDRKGVFLEDNQVVVMSILDNVKKILIEKELVCNDSYKGRYSVVFQEKELRDLDASIYTASFYVAEKDLSNPINIIKTSNGEYSTKITKDMLEEDRVVITHNLNSKNVSINVYDNNNYKILPHEAIILDNNTVEIDFDGMDELEGEYTAVIVGGNTTDVSMFNVVFDKMNIFNGSEYVLTHDLDTMDVSVTIYDSNGNEILPNNITVLDNSHIVIDMMYFDLNEQFKAVVFGGSSTYDFVPRKEILYTSSDWDIKFPVRLVEDTYHVYKEPKLVDPSTFNEDYYISKEDGFEYRAFTSSIIKADITSNHTASVLSNGFIGTVVMEGTLDINPKNRLIDWGELASYTFVKEEEIIGEDGEVEIVEPKVETILLQATSNVQFIRFKYYYRTIDKEGKIENIMYNN